MIKILFIGFCILSFSLHVFADQFDDQLQNCKGNPDITFCSSKVLLAALREFVRPTGTPASIPPRCQCQCGGVNAVQTCTLYFIEKNNALVLANGLMPRDCVEALRYPPCRD